jgi:hypothetical protein
MRNKRLPQRLMALAEQRKTRPSEPQMTGPSQAEPRPISAQSQAHEGVWTLTATPQAGLTGAGLAGNVEPARRFVDRQRAAGARKIGDIAQVIQRAAGQLEPELPRVAKSVHEAAGFVEQAATALRERSVDELVASCTRFARAQPAAFFAAAAFTGFVAARFIKSSVDPARGIPTR